MCCKTFRRRDFLGLTSGLLAGSSLASAMAAGASQGGTWSSDRWDPDRPFLKTGKRLTVQPILMYAVSHKREASSWKSWGGVQTEQGAAEECERIAGELRGLEEKAGFPLEFLPVVKVKTPGEAQRFRRNQDVTLVYAATGSGDLLRACVPDTGDTLLFVRHRCGPVYYWYEALSTRYLATSPQGQERASAPGPALPGVSVEDVVVDDTGELLWRLRALHAVKSFLGTRIVALGGPWGKYASDAPKLAEERFHFRILNMSYEELEPRLKKALGDKRLMATAEAWASRYLSLPGTKLQTDRGYVVNAFVLYGLFKDLMEENNATAFTIKDCMRTIMPMSRTTACLTLGLLNDEGLLAFCESDFVIIPAGILLRYVTGTPVFLHNSTFPHKGIVTCAHCSAPRRMNGDRYEPTNIMTHYESEFGAAPKVEIPLGQKVTFVDPEYSTGRWVGFTGVVEANPLLEICRSQQDVSIQGDWKKLLREARDSHWMMAYGDHLEAFGYAAQKVGVQWETIQG